MVDDVSVFISYAWSNEDHKEWVLSLARQLRENGVDAKLDRWGLQPGNDAHAFMERMVTDERIKKVILIFDECYVQKANSRQGGVGTETQIVTGKIYERVDQDKFVGIALVRGTDGGLLVPAFYGSRIYVDFSAQEQYASNFEKLLRFIFGRPADIAPPLGKAPAYLFQNESIIGTNSRYLRARTAWRDDLPYKDSALQEYFDALSSNMASLKSNVSDENSLISEFDRTVDAFLPFRNEFIETCFAVIRGGCTPRAIESCHGFFETIANYLNPAKIGSYWEGEADNFKFICNEMFIYFIAMLIDHKRFEELAIFLDTKYYRNSEIGLQAGVYEFAIFDDHLRTLEFKNRVSSTKQISLQAFLLKSREMTTPVNFRKFMQADFFLFLRSLGAKRATSMVSRHSGISRVELRAVGDF